MAKNRNKVLESLGCHCGESRRLALTLKDCQARNKELEAETKKDLERFKTLSEKIIQLESSKLSVEEKK